MFECARNGNEEIFRWFMGTNDFFKARGTQNYKGRTIEHIVCMHNQHPIVDEINPRPDTPDYYGCLPLYYSIKENDFAMIKKQFRAGKEYFKLKNYKSATIFHMAGLYNAKESLELMCGKHVFVEHLLKRDYKGNTAFHSAAKSGSFETLQFLMGSATPAFLEI